MGVADLQQLLAEFQVRLLERERDQEQLQGTVQQLADKEDIIRAKEEEIMDKEQEIRDKE